MSDRFSASVMAYERITVNPDHMGAHVGDLGMLEATDSVVF